MKKRERGSAAVETALVLPFVVMIVIAIAEYGYYYLTAYKYQQAVFAGARAGAIAQVGKDAVARSETLRLLGAMGIKEGHAPAVAVSSGLEGPIDGKTLIEVTIDSPYTPLTGYAGLILPKRVAATASQLNY
jgi:uncharacterized membrane protein